MGFDIIKDLWTLIWHRISEEINENRGCYHGNRILFKKFLQLLTYLILLCGTFLLKQSTRVVFITWQGGWGNRMCVLNWVSFNSSKFHSRKEFNLVFSHPKKEGSRTASNSSDLKSALLYWYSVNYFSDYNNSGHRILPSDYWVFATSNPVGELWKKCSVLLKEWRTKLKP